MGQTPNQLSHANGSRTPIIPFSVVMYELLQHPVLRFVAVGAVNTLFGYGIFFLTYEVTDNTTLSLVVSTLLGIIFNFYSTGIVVFHGTDFYRIWPFMAVYATVFLCNIAGLHVCYHLSVSPLFGQAALLPVITTLSYLLNRTFVFSSTR
jgi:putative flippase GtrA